MLLNTPIAKESIQLQTILSYFSEASGTTFNLDKSHILFFNTPLDIYKNISCLLGIPHNSLLSIYLGLPLIDSAARNISWNSLLLSISNHLSSWTFRSLNLPDRLILLKAVLQAILTYMFSVLVAPQTIIKSTINVQNNFLWNGHKQGRKWTLVGWEKI
jgi:hypothetical protein